MKMKFKLWILVGIVGFVTQSASLYAHDHKVIHPYVLSSKARNLLCTDANGDLTELGKKYKEIFDNFEPIPANLDQLPSDPNKGTLGTIEEDNSTRPLGHFYRPTDGAGLFDVIDTNGLAQSKILWKEAIEKYSDDNYSDAYYLLKNRNTGGDKDIKGNSKKP